MEQVVLVHGLWVPSVVLSLLARRLRTAGFETHRFDYQTRSEELRVLAGQLEQFIVSRSLPRVHLLAHSFGGLVVLEMLARHPETPPGRVVLLGSPVGGSKLARHFRPGLVGRVIFGKSGKVLAAGCGPQVVQRETGVIAGNRPFGMGRLFGIFDEPNDGAVAVSETRIRGLTADIELPVTHTGMLFSSVVARQTIRFLESGDFQTHEG